MAESFEDNQKDVLEKAVQRFIDAHLAGQEPDIDEFVKDYPGLEDKIRQRIHDLRQIDSLFSSLMEAENDDFVDSRVGDDLIGQTLGDFEILSLIGAGGMGAVFLAHQISLDRDVALKVISDISSARKKSIERFKREAKVLAKISHPNIVPIYEVGEQGPYSYFAMEYVQGVSLEKILSCIRNTSRDKKASDVLRKCLESQGSIYSNRTGAAEETNGAEIDTDYIVNISRLIISIATALDYAHNKGVLHRDVKPSNILIAPDGTAKLVDFGLARAETQQTITVSGEFFGTPSYVSPEQIRRPETVDCRSDVYSLAATYYECLTLHPPFEGNTVNETLTRVISREAIPPKKYCPRLSSDLNTVLLHALEKSPEDRYKSAADFADDIQSVLDFKPITAKRPSIATKTYKVLRRNPMKLALVIGTVLLCILGYWLLSYELQSKTRKVAQGLFDAARSKQTVRNYAEALTLFQKALTKDKSYVDAYLGAAECQRLLSNYDEAIRLSREAISLDRNSAMAYYQLGSTFVGQKDFEQAKRAFQKVLSIDKNFSLAHTGLSVCYGMLGLNNEAVEELRQVIKIDPTHPQRKEILFNIANILTTLGKYHEAIESYQAVLLIDPTYAGAYLGLGICHFHLSDQTKAQEAFKKAASFEPTIVEARAQLARIYINDGRPSLAVNTYRSAGEDCQRAGKFEQAIQFYNSALEIDPNNVLILMAAGDCYQALKKFGEATSTFKKASTCASDDSNMTALAYLKLGNCLSEVGLDAYAEKAYLEAIDKNPNYYIAYFTLGAHYSAEGLYEDAINIYKKAIIIDPERLESYKSLGSCYMSLLRYAEAIQYYEKCLSDEPNNPSVLLSTALCYQGLEDHVKVIELIEKVVKIEPNNSMVYSTLGFSYDSVGKYFDALGAYNKSLAFDPGNPTTLGCLGECYEKLGIYDEAIKSYEKSLALQPNSPLAFTKLAVIYGMCKDAKFRDGDKAVKLATKACELTKYNHYLCLSSLAAAYAECGDFDKAIEYQTKAIELADDNVRAEYEKRLAAYKVNKPWRE
jgi:tetratricopeptide (TPR) repeat protein